MRNDATPPPEPDYYRRRHPRPEDEIEEPPAHKKSWAQPLLVAFACFLVGAGIVFAFLLYFLPGKRTPEVVQTPPPVAALPAPAPAATPRPSPAGEAAPPQPAPAPRPKAPRITEPQRAKPAVRERAPSAPGKKNIDFQTEPAGAFLLFDENPDLMCRTPCTMAFAAGRHTVKASLDGFPDGLRVFEVPLQTFVMIQMQARAGRLGVKTNPPGATIFVNGKERPEKTPALFSLPAGKYKVAVQLQGRTREEEDIEIRPDATKNFNVDWGNR